MAFTFASCEKNEVTETISQTETNRLSFNTREEVLQAIQAFDEKGDCDILVKNPNFVSYAKVMEKGYNKGIQKVSDITNDNLTLALDSLLPNKSFAALLNPEGEIALNDTIFKITPNGTYKFHKSKEKEFYELYSTNPNMKGDQLSEEYYEIAYGIYRYDTFKEVVQEVSPNVEPSYVTGYLKVASSTNSEPDFNSFPTYNAERHTFFGKIVESIIGGTKSYEVDFKTNSDKRLKGKFYFYNYGIYAETGVTGTTQRKRWIGWSDTS